MNLEGKTAIVTGAGRDIGRACAMRLAAEGAKVALSYHASSDGALGAVAEIEKKGGNAIAVQADLHKPSDVDALVKSTVDAFGSVDILVNNSGGILARKTFAEMSLEHWNDVISLNTTSIFLMIKTCLPHMKTGAIVNIASQAGRDGGGPGSVAYAASKGAVMSMSRGLAKELGPDIRCNAICPGMIDTDFHNIFTKPEVRANVAKSVPARREGTSEDVANLVYFLSCDESAYITGANYDINGGLAFS